MGADFGHFDIFIEETAFRKLHPADGPKIEIVGLFLEFPKFLGQFLFIVFKFCVIGAERWGDARD